jgi:hypothetical protein
MGGTTKADQMWKVRRVWSDDNGDEEEDEHNVNNEDLYRRIKKLVGAPQSPEYGLPKMPQRNWHFKKIVETDGEVDQSLPEESVHDDEIEQRVVVMTEVARLEQVKREKAREEYKKEKEEYKKGKAATAAEGAKVAPEKKPKPYYEVIRGWNVEDEEDEKKESKKEVPPAATKETAKPKRYYRIIREWSVQSGDMNVASDEDEDDSSEEASTSAGETEPAYKKEKYKKEKAPAATEGAEDAPGERPKPYYEVIRGWSVEDKKKESRKEGGPAEETAEEEVPAGEAEGRPKRCYRILREWSGDKNVGAVEDEQGEDDSSEERSTSAGVAEPPAPAPPTKSPKTPTKTEGFRSSAPDNLLWWQRDDAKEKEARLTPLPPSGTTPKATPRRKEAFHASSSASSSEFPKKKTTGFRSSAPVDCKVWWEKKP